MTEIICTITSVLIIATGITGMIIHANREENEFFAWLERIKRRDI